MPLLAVWKAVLNGPTCAAYLVEVEEAAAAAWSQVPQFWVAHAIQRGQ